MSNDDLESVFMSLDKNAFAVKRNVIENGIPVLDLLATATNIFPSKGEARKMIQAGGVSLNKEKIADANSSVSTSNLLNNKFMLVQKGKKNYYLLKAE